MCRGVMVDRFSSNLGFWFASTTPLVAFVGKGLDLPGGDDPTFVSGVRVFGRSSVNFEVLSCGNGAFTADIPLLLELVDPAPRVSDGVVNSSCDPETVWSDAPLCIESLTVSGCVSRGLISSLFSSFVAFGRG